MSTIEQQVDRLLEVDIEDLDWGTRARGMKDLSVGTRVLVRAGSHNYRGIITGQEEMSLKWIVRLVGSNKEVEVYDEDITPEFVEDEE